MMNKLAVACVQMNSQSDIALNIKAAEGGVAEAAEKGAQFIALPENAFYMREQGGGEKVPRYREEEHPGVQAAREWAYRYGVGVLIGSVAVVEDEADLPFNRSILIAQDGSVSARYDKIHLFDVELPGGEVYAESSRVRGGKVSALADTPWGYMGLSICYDLRFPHLYRALAKAGARMLAIPAAFTETTGKAHWHVLTRARAIENGCFVIAPAQGGLHPGGRRTYGHSLIIGPWGEVLAEGSPDAPGVIMAELDLSRVDAVRAQVPSLRHDREFSCPPAASPVSLPSSGN